MQYAQAYLGLTRPNGMKSINDLRTAFEVANKGYALGRNVKH